MAFEYLDRFEDGDASDWTNLTALNDSTLSGNWLGENSANNESVTSTSPTFTEFQNDLYFEAYITDDTGNANDGVIYSADDSGGNRVFNIEHEDSTNDLYFNGSIVGSWSPNTVYEFRINPDYGAQTVDLIRNGTTLATDVSMVDAGLSGIDVVEVFNNTSASATQRSAYIDDVAYFRAPNTPQNFAAVQANRGEIDTSWGDVSQEDSYNLYRAESSGVTTSDTLVTEPGQDVTTYTDTGREDGEQFFYAVSAEDEEGESALSTEDSAITILPPTDFDTVQNT